MNIRHTAFALCIFTMTTTNIILPAMNEFIWVSKAFLPIYGTISAIKLYNDYRLDRAPLISQNKWPKRCFDWVENIREEMGIQKKIRYTHTKLEGLEPIFCTDNAITIDSDSIEEINDILGKPVKTEDDNAMLARKSVCIKHEFGHVASEDSWNIVKSSFMIPAGIQAGCFSISYTCNKIFGFHTKINQPTRCAGAMIALYLKVCVWGAVERMRCQYRETMADQFAFEHATPEEIKAFIVLFKKYEQELLEMPQFKDIADDPIKVRKAFFYLQEKAHPYPADRITMAEKYLHHKNNNIKIKENIS